MKKLTSILLALAMVLVLTACATEDVQETGEPTVVPTPESTPSQQTPELTPEPTPEPIPEQPPIYDPIADDVPIITAHEAVAEMKIGINLGSVLDFFDWSRTVGYDNYQYPYVPVAVFFWYTDLINIDMVRYPGIDYTYDISIYLQSIYDDDPNDAWKNTVHMGVFDDENLEQSVNVEFIDTRVEMPDGTIYELNDIKGEHVFDDYDLQSVEDGGASICAVPMFQLEKKFEGGTFKTGLRILNTPGLITVNESKAEFWTKWENGNPDFQTRQQNIYQLIDDIHSVGFNYIRFMTTWTSHVNDETFEIDEEWLATVKLYVDYILAKGMYVSINTNYDYFSYSWVGDKWVNDWMLDEYKEYVDARFVSMWQQIAEYFQDYGQKLIFEAMNEPTMEWSVSLGEKYEGRDFYIIQIDRINELNALFVETVRSAGGKNGTRFLTLGGAWNDGPYERYLLDGRSIPDDDYIIARINWYYHRDYGTYGNDHNAYPIDKIDKVFDMVDEFMVRTELPVIFTEWGMNKYDLVEERRESMLHFVNRAKQSGIPCTWYEGANQPEAEYGDFTRAGFYNRYKMEWIPEELPILIEMMEQVYPDYDYETMVSERSPER